MKIAIIGSGISGLYCAYILKKNGHDVDIYEKNSNIGGRVKVIEFDGIDVVSGAGIGRKKKDKLLFKLCKELKVTTNDYKTKFSYTFEPYNILEVINYLKKFIPYFDRSKYTFSQFAKKILGLDIYNHLTKSINGTDFEDADIIDTIYDYGFEDCVSGYMAFSIKWKEMLNSFSKIFKDNIHLNSKIEKVSFTNDQKIKIKNKIYDRIVLAIPPKTIGKLLSLNIYNDIKCQSFVRLYVKLNEPLKNYSGFIVTEKPFQKIIEMNREKCIYMISYSDNKIADAWYYNKNRKETVEKYIKKIFNQDLKVKKIKFIYWKCGTHYYKPLNTNKYKDRHDFLKIAQNPFKNVYCVGEAFSRNQGWCEGALESVENVYSKLF